MLRRNFECFIEAHAFQDVKASDPFFGFSKGAVRPCDPTFSLANRDGLINATQPIAQNPDSPAIHFGHPGLRCSKTW